MAFLNICGFETGNTMECALINGTFSIQTTTKRTGTYAAQFETHFTSTLYQTPMVSVATVALVVVPTRVSCPLALTFTSTTDKWEPLATAAITLSAEGKVVNRT